MRGFRGGSPNQNGFGPGGGIRTLNGCVTGRRGGGGGYGGQGGTSGLGIGGPVNGSPSSPITLGSGGAGGGCSGEVGGAGGGRVELTANVLALDGTISALGGSAASRPRSGGGSGGAVWLKVGDISGTGLVRANGGAGDTTSDPGGGGGGGRVVLFADQSTFSGTSEALGGGGARPGQPGQVVVLVGVDSLVSLCGPADGGDVLTVAPELCFAGLVLSAGQQFVLEVDDDPFFGQLSETGEAKRVFPGVSSPFTLPVALTIDNEYFWHVYIDEAGPVRGGSPIRSFTTPVAPPEVSFAAAASTTGESGNQLSVDVRLQLPGGGALGQAVTVDVVDALTGSADSEDDYAQFGDQQAVFPVGSTDGAVESVALTLVNDSLLEGDETVDLQIRGASGAGAIIVGPSDHRVTIEDDETVEVVFDVTSGDAPEEGGEATVALRLRADAGVTLAVAVEADVDDALSGSAEEDADYDALGTQTVTFAVGSADGETEAVSLGVLDDLLVEGPETVDLRITGVTGPAASIGPQNDHVVTILDNERVDVVFDVAASSTAEDAGAHGVSVRLDADAGVTLAVPISVDVTDVLSGTASSGADYAGFSEMVTFPVGSADGDSRFVDLLVTDDSLLEGDESVHLELTSLVGPSVSIGAQSEHTATILDDERVELVFDVAASSAGEAAGGHDLLLRLVADAGVTLAVPISTDVTDVLSGTASSGADYTAFGTQMVTLPVGTATGDTQPVSLDVLDDLLLEGDESVHLELTNAVGPGVSIGAQGRAHRDDSRRRPGRGRLRRGGQLGGRGQRRPRRARAAGGWSRRHPGGADHRRRGRRALRLR